MNKLLRIVFGLMVLIGFSAHAQAQSTLLHYWHFNTLNKAFNNPNIPPLTADFSILDTSKVKLIYALYPGTSPAYTGFIDNVGGDTANARNSTVAGQALRFRNPSDSAELRLYIPSTGYKNLVLKWEVESSSVGSGQKTQLFDYSIDSGLTWKTSGLSITSVDITQAIFQGSSWGVISVGLSGDTLTNNNPKLVFRIRFAGNTSLTSGNNRFDNITVDGTFVPPVSNVPLSLIHYWSFNTLTTAYHNPGIPPLKADFSTIDTVGAKLVYTLFPGTSPDYAGFIDNNNGDLTNARNGAPAGQSLRFRNPSDSAELRLYIPTNNYTNIVIKYALQSSSAASGQKTQVFDYSTDAGLTWKTSGLSIKSLDVTQPQFQGSNWGFVTVNLASDSSVNNNYYVIFRIKFSGNTTGGNGNNRFDNISVEGTYVPPVAAVYSFTSPSAGNILTVGKHAAINFTVSGPVGKNHQVQYTTNHGLTWSLVGMISGTSIDWIVPNSPSDNVYLRVVDEFDNWAGVGPFTIFYPGKGKITVSKPAKGDTLFFDSKETITFSVSGVVSETRFIDYSVDSGKNWKNIGSVILGTSIDWQVPSAPTATALVRVRDTVDVVGISSPFTIAPVPATTLKTELIHYWNFDNVVNDTISPQKPKISDLFADYSILDKTKAKISYYLLPGTSLTASLRFIDPVAPGADTNKRSVVAPGAVNNGLRLRNPLDSMELRCAIATTGHSNIVIRFALESSSTASGDSTDIFDYSIDGGLTWKNGKASGMKVNGSNVDTLDTTPLVYQGTSWGLVSVDLSADKSVENNPNVIFRIRFKGNTSLAKGNNRIDNFTVEGDIPSTGQLSLLDYWNFDNIVNDTISPQKPKISDLTADYSALDKSKAKIMYYLLPGTSLTASLRFIDPVAPGADTNMRSIVAPGAVNNGLRLRNPLDSMELRCAIPTTNFSKIIIKFALESSSTASGDSTDIFDYSIDGGLTWKNGKASGMKVNGSNVDTLDTTPLVYQGTSWGLVSVDLSADKSVENNPNFIFRIRFKGNTSLAKGNNRFDNFTVEGVSSEVVVPPAPAITVTAPVAKDTLVIGAHKTITFVTTGEISPKRTIEYSPDGGSRWNPVGTVTNVSTFDWIVPNAPTGSGIIRVTDSSGVLGKSGTFAIVAEGSVSTVTVGTTPGTVIEGQAVDISWTASGYLGSTVNLDLSLDTMKTWTPIKTSFSYKTASSYSWTAPTVSHAGAIVRLTFASGASGISSPFNIVSGQDGVAPSSIGRDVRVIPNPLSERAAIGYELTDDVPVTLSVRDILGREVSHIVTDIESSGLHEIMFDASRIAPGTYVYILTAGGVVREGKLVIAR